MTDVRTATAADLPAAGRALAAAFADDPVWSWMVPEKRWARHAAPWFEMLAGLHDGEDGEVFVDDAVVGAAVWSAPDHWKSSPAETVRLLPAASRLFGHRLARSLRTLRAIERHHPTEPHWYLSLVGTDPPYQGRGIGSALISAMTHRCDIEGVPAYLESSKESNIALYARHGFELRDRIDLPGGGPSLWPMWREPRS